LFTYIIYRKLNKQTFDNSKTRDNDTTLLQLDTIHAVRVSAASNRHLHAGWRRKH